MVIPLPYHYLNDDKIQLLYDATSKEIIGEKKVTVRGNVKGTVEVNAKTSGLIKALAAELAGRGSGEAGKERIEEYVVTIPINKKLQSLESYFKQNDIKIFNLNIEKQFETYVGNFITATIPFKGTKSEKEEKIDLNGKLDDYSVHISASIKYFKPPTGYLRLTLPIIPIGLNVFGSLGGIDVKAKIMEIEPIAF